MTQPGGAHPALEALGVAAGAFPVDEKSQPFGMGQIGGAVADLRFGKGLGHAVELQGLELIQGWMIEHDVSLSMEVIGATDIGMCDRGLVRGAGARGAIQTILQNGMQR